MFHFATWGSTATCWLPRRHRSTLCPSVRAILPVGESLLPRTLEFGPGRGSECPGFHAGLVPRYLMMLAGPAAHQATGTPTGAFRTISTTGAFSSVAWIRQDFTARRMPAWSFGFNSGVVTKTCKRPILAGWVMPLSEPPRVAG